ncbi:NAD(P)H-binding protein [Massilia sp. S19_KUP03_FR1]|uniref:NAD(P)H-binding protein n=1 Tax=Massilia sp. S19_KUP03_FR1 TaxID=3025503 RepID=UPI003FA582D5
MARVLLARGWRVQAMHRAPQSVAEKEDGLQWCVGDAMNQQDVISAAQGVALIVHAVNPPGYRNWDALVLPMLDNTIAAARLSGARILLPGTVHNFGPDVFPLIEEDAPQNPRTRKAAIRVEMEARMQASAATGVRTLIVRSGDFFGPNVGNSWFSQGLVKPGIPFLQTYANLTEARFFCRWIPASTGPVSLCDCLQSQRLPFHRRSAMALPAELAAVVLELMAAIRSRSWSWS